MCKLVTGGVYDHRELAKFAFFNAEYIQFSNSQIARNRGATKIRCKLTLL
ncbi:hypothetical protein yfred0001_11940 [Yersinia frederiksenii ATCC 33641]|nr:hypothetical protein yfred0001_11940 [Yersinia frederiksenii ATCC 33641]